MAKSSDNLPRADPWDSRRSAAGPPASDMQVLPFAPMGFRPNFRSMKGTVSHPAPLSGRTAFESAAKRAIGMFLRPRWPSGPPATEDRAHTRWAPTATLATIVWQDTPRTKRLQLNSPHSPPRRRVWRLGSRPTGGGEPQHSPRARRCLWSIPEEVALGRTPRSLAQSSTAFVPRPGPRQPTLRLTPSNLHAVFVVDAGSTYSSTPVHGPHCSCAC